MPILDELFAPDVMARLRARQSPSSALRGRLNILSAPGITSSDETPPGWIRYLMARRTAWEQYISAMQETGLLDDDVKARLTSDEDQDFRGAMAECLVCQLIVDRLGLSINGRPEGRLGRVPDFSVQVAGGTSLTIEVKSPFSEPPRNTTFGADYAQLVEPLIDAANKQFSTHGRNVLAIVPFADPPVLSDVRPFLKAFYGEHKITFEIDTRTGRAMTQPRQEFFADGKFLKLWPEPRFTRTGAVIVVRESVDEEGAFEDEGRAEARLRWFVLHNPHSPNSIPQDIWGDCPQFVSDGEILSWNDGAKIYRN